MADIQLVVAKIPDIVDVLALQRKYQIDSIAEADKKDGFVTTSFSTEELARLVFDESGLFIARKDGVVVGYAMAASWQYWASWPMFQFMAEELPTLAYAGNLLGTLNSYQYGPICLDKSVRGSGLLEQLFHFSKHAMSNRFEVLVTFVNEENPRSYQAHSRKLELDVINEFQFNGHEYYEMACLTHSKDINDEKPS